MPEGVEYRVRALLEASGGAKSLTRFQKFASGLAKHSARLQTVGQSIAGTTIQTGAMMASMAAGSALLAGAAGFGAVIKGAVSFNAELEQSRYAIATTLQLMDHQANVYQRLVGEGMNPANAAAEQFAANLRAGEATMDRLFLIAAKSPATFDEAQTMFRNMLPGARAVTGNMEEILDLTKKSLSLGLVMGGDFATTGAQMSRILTGGAGAEFETWKVLQKPILDAGKASGIFNDSLQMGAKLTEEFNRLSPEQRLELVTKATDKLGVATDALGSTWTGVTSTILSNFQLIQKELGKATFEQLKGRFKAWTAEGGLLDPEGKTMAKLQTMAASIGAVLGKWADKLANVLGGWISYLADNWPEVIRKFQTAWDTGLRVAKLMLKAAAVRAIVGGGAMAAGGIGRGVGLGIEAGRGAFGMLGKLIGNIGKLGTIGPALAGIGPAIAGISTAAIAFLPIALIAGAALLGVGVIFGAAIAWFVDNWDAIVLSINNGTLSLAPLLDALEVMWNGFVRLGATLFGGSDAVGTMQNAIYFMTDAVYFMLATFVLGMKVLGAFQFVFNAFILGIKSIGLALIGLVEGIMWVAKKIDETFGALLPESVSKRSKENYDAVNKFRMQFVDGMKQDANDATRMWNAADKLLEGQSEGRFARGIEKALREDKKPGDLGGTGGAGKPPKAPAGGNTIIQKMVVHQDLRNQDPDRVIGAFYRAVDKSVRNRTQATTLQPGGI